MSGALAWVLAFLPLTACGPAHAVAHGSAMPRPSGSAAWTSIAPDAACPPIDLGALAPPPPILDARTFALRDVFPREQLRAGGATVWSFDLGRVAFSRDISGDPGSSGVGMGWEGLSDRWPLGELGPPIAASLRVWMGHEIARSDLLRGSFLLGQRVNLLHAVPPSDGGEEARCASIAKARADAEASVQDRAARAELSRLVGLLDARTARSAGEKLLLGYFLDEAATRSRPATIADSTRSLDLFAEVAADQKAPLELRARAEELSARVYLGASDGRVFGERALRQVIALTQDPDLEVDTLIKIAALSPDGVTKEELLEKIIAKLDAGAGGWRRGEALGTLAKLRLERGAYDGAREAAVRCAREVDKDFPDDPDPWGCAPLLASALIELGGVPGSGTSDPELPLSFLGPLALELVKGSCAALDRDEARHAGELLLSKRPEASEAPQVIDLLMSISNDATERGRLAQMRAIDYGPDAPWTLRQRTRLAPDHDLGELDQAMRRLTDPPSPVGTPPPEGDARRADLEARIERVIQSCARELSDARGDLSLHVDTTAATPRAQMVNATPKVAACLARAVSAHFRSVGPAHIAFTLFAR